MKAETGFKIALGIAGIAAAAYLLKQGSAAASAVGSAANAVNPFNNDNIFNRAFNSAYQGVTGSDGTLGTDLYDALHSDNGQNVFSPANPQNPVNQAAVGAYQAATGSTGTIGTDLYDFLNPSDGQSVWTKSTLRDAIYKWWTSPPPVDNTILDARDAMAKKYIAPAPVSPMGDVYHGGD